MPRVVGFSATVFFGNRGDGDIHPRVGELEDSFERCALRIVFLIKSSYAPTRLSFNALSVPPSLRMVSTLSLTALSLWAPDSFDHPINSLYRAGKLPLYSRLLVRPFPASRHH